MAQIQYTVGSFYSGKHRMTLGTWNPNIQSADSDSLLSTTLLNRFISYDREDRLGQLGELLSADEQQSLAGLMKIDHQQWRAAAESLPETDLIHLIRFFAVAENLPGWEAGADSPVIPLAKLLRKRGARLEKPLLQWLRDVNENRYLPYGPL